MYTMDLRISAQELLEFHERHHFGASRIRQHVLDSRESFLSRWAKNDSLEEHKQATTRSQQNGLEEANTHATGAIDLSELVLDPETLKETVSEDDFDEATRDFIRAQKEHKRRFQEEVKERNLLVKEELKPSVTMNY